MIKKIIHVVTNGTEMIPIYIIVAIVVLSKSRRKNDNYLKTIIQKYFFEPCDL